MIRTKFLPLAVVWALAACSGNPLGNVDGGGGGPVDPGTPGTGTVPAVLSVNLRSVTGDFSGGAGTVAVEFNSQDAAALNADYVRNPAFDQAGYLAYSYQETTSNRFVIALVREVGSARGAIVVDGGQFINYFGGGTYARADVFSIPTEGVGARYNYSGSYVGLMNIGRPAPGGPGGGLNPEQSYVTEGRALITADFTEGTLSGGIDQRRIINPQVGQDPALPDAQLFSTTIAEDGSFLGNVFVGQTDAGDYGGVFAGINASEVAALLVFSPYGSPPIMEHGLIVLGNCADNGGPACP